MTQIITPPSSLLELHDAQTIAARSQSNFSTAFIFLPREKRLAIRRVYAFFRVIDDVVDEGDDLKQQGDLLAVWKYELHQAYHATTIVPLLKELKESIDRFHIPEEYFLQLIEGCELDLTKTRYQTFTDLYQYCYRVASMVGLVCLKIFEYQSPTARQAAIDLGLALQLTNIIRDVGVDADKGRIYLPLEELEKFSVSEAELLDKKPGENFRQLMLFQYQRAQNYFGKTEHEILNTKNRQLLPAQIMGKVYRRLLDKIKHRHFPVLTTRVRLSFAEKMLVLTKTILQHYLP